MHTLSFCILNDLSVYNGYGPVHVSIDDLEYDTLKKALDEFSKPFLKYISNQQSDPEYYWYKSQSSDEECDPTGYYFEQDYNVSEVIQDLSNNKYYCWNRYQKYYVVAFSIDYVRFNVFSKDCDKMVIKWRKDDQNDEIIPDDLDNNYNENPVISLLSDLRYYDGIRSDQFTNDLNDEDRSPFMNKTDVETILSTNLN